ncbi:sugar ABC transporter ATP-binding protein [Neomoorella mulderi]|uniref:sugar ABC transporter ATP-binding protein n=1 Tax=Neomoorella mulderi TaxID=202604 RepID=UPI000784DB9D|nr:sugar ABC transporter ATP-binding protein [Moorella mulderi]
MQDYVLEMKNITKIFPGVKAIDDVTFSVKKGEVHALLGENGAGKTTLMKILAGVYRPEKGTIYLNGQKVQINSRKRAQELGIAMIFQELSVLPNLDIAGNLFLAREKKKGILLDNKQMEDEARSILEYLGLKLNPKTIVENLSVGERQLVEIARAITSNAKIIVMDEPTSALTQDEQEKLFGVIDKLKKQGTAIIYVSHRMDEIFRIADRITILRDGKKVNTVLTRDVNKKEIISMMIGEKEVVDELSKRKQHSKKFGEPLLEVEKLTGKKINNVSFKVRSGEILGLAGLLGSGRTEILRAICGLDNNISGNIKVDGKKYNIKSLQDALRLGIILVPEDRRNEGIIPGMSVMANLSLTALANIFPNGIIKFKTEHHIASKNIQELNIQPCDPYKLVGKLSGGNQQKVVIGRCLNHNPKILLLDEPTQGIDIGAKAELHALFRTLAEKGMAIIIVSSELPELVSIADNVLVLYEGQVRAFLSGADIEEKKILYYATGGFESESGARGL